MNEYVLMSDFTTVEELVAYVAGGVFALAILGFLFGKFILYALQTIIEDILSEYRAYKARKNTKVAPAENNSFTDKEEEYTPNEFDVTHYGEILEDLENTEKNIRARLFWYKNKTWLILHQDGEIIDMYDFDKNSFYNSDNDGVVDDLPFT